ncbi:MAG: CRISPR-associated helicase Cas3' [Leptospiraceae bacterium]|nr:CRISPR-associated helicase Cas3' [Leptospiraceae bacterium]MCP5497270.1 CRISPR-associated helicase Cas3' [Leptospiraceae bacterium]
MKSYYNYWGKAGKDGNYHLLPYHCLDVAAVAEILFQENPKMLNKFVELTKFEDGLFRYLFLFFLAIHDLGKFADSFQGQVSELYSKLNPGFSPKVYNIRHDSLGYILWNKKFLINKRGRIEGKILDSNIFGLGTTDSNFKRNFNNIASIFISIATGHHGRPPSNTGYTTSVDITSHFTERNIQDSFDFLSNVYQFFLKEPILEKLNQLNLEDLISSFKTVSFWIAGFTVLCDWIGSNGDIFKFVSEEKPIEEYWNDFAIPSAREAIKRSGILPSKVSKYTNPQDLFSYLETPTPLQSLCDSLQIKNGPQLFILEDVTGAGKTEASLILAKRLLSNCEYDGLYIGLPTMATANGMYERVASFYRKIYEPDSKPSLILAHSAKDLSDQFRQTIISENIPEDVPYAEDEESASALCSAWLADSSKKSTLASVSVGTIDQALVSVLLSKFQSLRLFGLFNKVLILDEIHAYDEYMNELIETLLKVHSQIGGSIILLSATIPQNLKNRFIGSFLNRSINEVGIPKKHYPLMTMCGNQEILEIELATREEVRRSVKVDFIHNLKEVYALIQRVVTEGKCICWIRNTVSDSMVAYENIKKLYGENNAILFHARFAMGDRLDIESEVLRMFGKNSTNTDRKGKIVIATQVVEQSLDLDFDVMVTDLAPIDLIIQRAGRLHRHTRDFSGNRITEKDQRNTPFLYIHSPELTEDPSENWYSSFSKGGAMVYPDHGKLFLTADILNKRGEIKMPEDARNLIEYVYGESQLIPEKLVEKSRKNTEKEKQKRAQAENNTITIESGYTSIDNSSIWNEINAPTRLGGETIKVLLLKYQNRKLKPWYAKGTHALPNSEVKVLSYIIHSEFESEDLNLKKAIKDLKEKLPGKGKYSLLLPLQEVNGMWIGFGLSQKGEKMKYAYDTKMGFRILKEGENE